MAWRDAARTRFRMTAAELAAATTRAAYGADALAHLGEAAAADLDALTTAGLWSIEHAQLDPYLQTLLEVLATAPLELVVQVQGAEVEEHLGWADPQMAVVAIEVGDHAHEYTLVDTRLLPWSLAVATGLGARPDPVEAGVSARELTIPAPVWDQALAAADRGDHAAIATTVTTALDVDTATTLSRLLQLRRTTWRAGSRWQVTEGGGHDEASFAMLDAGPAGYWQVHPATDGPGRPGLRLRACRPSEVWQQLAGLIPEHPDHDPPPPSPFPPEPV